MAKVATTNTAVREVLEKLSDETLRDYVLKLSAFVVTPPQRLNVILSNRLTMISFLEQNEKFFSIAGIVLPDQVQVHESGTLPSSTSKDHLVETKTITVKHEDTTISKETTKERKPPGFGIRKQYNSIYSKTYLYEDKPTQVLEEMLDDSFTVTYYPLHKTITKNKYQFASLYISEIEYNGKKSVLYDLQRKPYIYTAKDSVEKTIQLLADTYDLKIDITSKFFYSSNGIYYTFLSENSANMYSIGFVVKTSYSSAASSTLSIGIINNVTGVFLPFSSQIKIEEVETPEALEPIVKEYLSVSRIIDTFDQDMLNTVVSARTKQFVKDITAYMKKAREVEKVLLKKEQ